MIVAAIAVVATEWHEDSIVQQRQSAPLVLHLRNEADAVRGEPRGDVDRETGKHAAIGQTQAVDTVPRRAMVVYHRVEVDGSAVRIDDGCAGDAKRGDVAARQRRAGDRLAEDGAPRDTPGRRIQRVDEVIFSCGNDEAVVRGGRPPVQGLRVDVPLDRTVERRVPADRRGRLPRQAGHDVVARAVGGAVVVGDGGVGGRCTECRRRNQHHEKSQAFHHSAPITVIAGATTSSSG